MDMIFVSLVNLAVVLILAVLLWIVSLTKHDALIIDPAWGIGFVLIAWTTMALIPQPGAHAWLLAALVSMWGLRLSGYLFWRNHGKAEDRRYRAMREKHGERFWWISLFTVFVLQACILWFVSLTVQAGMNSKMPSASWSLVVIGLLIWCVGFGFESVGDYQMARFKASGHEGEVLNRGLWRFTRHPNYFGDFCVWWGYFVIAAAVGAWWTILSPALMSVLLMKVSGVTLLESDIEDRRPAYADYKRRTNAFFPGPVKD